MDFEKYTDRARGFIQSAQSLAMREGHLVQVYDANAWRAPDAVLAQILKADR